MSLLPSPSVDILGRVGEREGGWEGGRVGERERGTKDNDKTLANVCTNMDAITCTHTGITCTHTGITCTHKSLEYNDNHCLLNSLYTHKCGLDIVYSRNSN